MPTIVIVNGWRLFFYANEGREPMHVHARKGGMECKYWIHIASGNVTEAFAFGLGPKDRREIRQIILDNLAVLETAWRKFQTRQMR